MNYKKINLQVTRVYAFEIENFAEAFVKTLKNIDTYEIDEKNVYTKNGFMKKMYVLTTYEFNKNYSY